MPLGIFRQSLNLANPVVTDTVGTWQGYFRSSSSTAVNAYNTANTSQGSVTHGCGTVAFIRARKIPFTTSHIVGIFGSTASKFYRYTAGTFTQLASMTAVGRHGDITFDTTTNKIYMVMTRTTSPYIQIYEADMSASVTTSTLLSNPATLPAGDTQSVRFTPDGSALAVLHAGSPYLTVYNRSGTTFTAVGSVPSITAAPDLGSGTVGLSWYANGLALAYENAGRINLNRWTGTAFIGTPILAMASSYTAAFNPNINYANILLVSTTTSPDDGAVNYYTFGNPGTISTTTANTGIAYQTEFAQWSPDGLKVYTGDSASAGYIHDLNTSYTTGTAIASLLTNSTSRSSSSRGFDWMYH